MSNIVVTFDTLEYANELKAGGVPEKQAEAQAKALSKITSSMLATKQDLKDVETSLKDVETSLKQEIRNIESRILYKLGGFITIGLTILGFILHK